MAFKELQITITGQHSGSLIERMFLYCLRNFQYGELTLTFASGNQFVVTAENQGPAASIHVYKPVQLLWRLLIRGDLGFAESYMHRDWDTPHLSELLQLLALNEAAMHRSTSGSTFSRPWDRLRHMLRQNNHRGSRRNIAYHYDLGNDFYELWLDSTMTYSGAIFHHTEKSLETAQRHKYRRILQALEAQPGQHILEIGCGWGGFAEEAALQGFKVTGITLSTEQLEFARERIRRAKLEEYVELRLQDYRDVQETYDHVVSIEMFEAVGESFWSKFFESVHACIRPGGRAAIQTITIHEHHYSTYQQGTDFIQLYIFPGGMLPSPTVFKAHARQAGLLPRAFSFYGLDYAKTLARWYKNFTNNETKVYMLGYGDLFMRMWRYYLAYCEAGFRIGRVNVMQAVLEHAD